MQKKLVLIIECALTNILLFTEVSRENILNKSDKWGSIKQLRAEKRETPTEKQDSHDAFHVHVSVLAVYIKQYSSAMKLKFADRGKIQYGCGLRALFFNKQEEQAMMWLCFYVNNELFIQRTETHTHTLFWHSLWPITECHLVLMCASLRIIYSNWHFVKCTYSLSFFEW